MIFIQTTVQQLFLAKSQQMTFALSPDEISNHQLSSSPGGSTLTHSCKIVFHNINVVESLDGWTDKQLKMSNSMYQLLPNF